MEKMWAGRFSKEVDSGVNAFNSSISFDGRMYKNDIEGSIAHATMLGEAGIITKEDSETLIKGLNEILADKDKMDVVVLGENEYLSDYFEREYCSEFEDIQQQKIRLTGKEN